MHPAIVAFYETELSLRVDGNGCQPPTNMITAAIDRSIEYRNLPFVSAEWENYAVFYSIRAAHAARMLGRIGE